MEKETFLLAEASRIVTTLFNLAGVRCNIINSGVMTHKVHVSHPDVGHFIVRFYPSSRSHVVHYEPDLFRAVRAAGIKTPKVVTDSRVGPPARLSYMVYEMVAGETLKSKLDDFNNQEIDAMAGQLIDFIKDLSRLEINGFGDLICAEAAQFMECRKFIAESFALDYEFLKNNQIIPASWCAGLYSVQKSLEDFRFPDTPSLAWGDLSPENIIVDKENNIAGFIDLESMVSCEPLLTLGFFSARYWCTAFDKALKILWMNEYDMRRMHLYSVLRTVRILKYAQYPLPTGVIRTPIEILLPGTEHSLNVLCR